MESNMKFLNIVKGVIISIICTLLFLFIFSLILTYTNVSEALITPVIIVITGISIFIGSSIGNIRNDKNGMINGGLVGGIYLLSIYLISSIINQRFSLTTQSVIIIAVGIMCGMFGGIIGVNKR